MMNLKNRRGEAIVVATAAFWFVAITLSAITLSSSRIKDPFRATKAVKLCYCMAQGTSEYVCKADETVIEYVEGSLLSSIALDTCKTEVSYMSKEEILEYIKDDVVMASSDNYGYIE